MGLTRQPYILPFWRQFGISVHIWAVQKAGNMELPSEEAKAYHLIMRLAGKSTGL